MVSNLPITFRKRNCGQCGHVCPRMHFTRKCIIGDQEVVMHLCSRYCVNSLHTIRCYGCRTLGLTLFRVSKYHRFCLPDHQQSRSCLALLCTPQPPPSPETRRRHCPGCISESVDWSLPVDGYGAVLMA